MRVNTNTPARATSVTNQIAVVCRASLLHYSVQNV